MSRTFHAEDSGYSLPPPSRQRPHGAAKSLLVRHQVAAAVGTAALVLGAYIGYRLPTQTFVPFTGTTPRVFDSRTTTKFAINEERVVDLGFVGARTAIINLTVTQTATAGFVAVFANGITYPGNSSINWSATNTDIANGVITQVDATGKIVVHASNVTHVVIDRIGFLV